MGTPEFAVPSLLALLDAGYDVAAVVTQPDKPAGRGLTQRQCAVKAAASSRGIRCMEPKGLKDPAIVSSIAAMSPEFIVVVAYGRILPQSVLDIPAKGCINLHASLLPRYRGASPINRAIMHGDATTGVCTMLLDAGMDTGPVDRCEETEISETDNAATLSARLSNIGATLLVRTLGLISDGALTPTAQDGTLATYAPPMKKEDGLIDWSNEAACINNLLRGVYPWPGAYTFCNGALLKIHAGVVSEQAANGAPPPGTIVRLNRQAISVSCGSGVFDVTEVQPEGKRRMAAGDFISGYRVKEGARLG
ncbi:MAG: methionyl-tRNA formyltransferase [Deltaproteobacteria bacterium]|nr:methionyl-tRNA formyltransferase [Deltaproteobacteria bacterium]